MKNILASILTIFTALAMAVGATGAWMEDNGGQGGYDFRTGKINLKIDHTRSVYDGLECVDGNWVGTVSAHSGDPCREWGAKDLDQKDRFYLFSDIKPGDWGQDIISLHANTKEKLNACIFAFRAKDKENRRNEPERGVDVTGEQGELSRFLQLFAWSDLNENSLFEPMKGEKELYRGLLKDEAIPVVLENKKPVFVGTAWCAGKQKIDLSTGDIACDGSGMGDAAQTDSLRLSLVGYAEAKRWYSPLHCRDVSRGYAEQANSGGDSSFIQ